MKGRKYVAVIDPDDPTKVMPDEHGNWYMAYSGCPKCYGRGYEMIDRGKKSVLLCRAKGCIKFCSLPIKWIILDRR